MNFTAIDFETANMNRASVCAVGLVVVANGQVALQKSQLIKPEPLLFDPFNVSIHGITDDDVAEAPTFAEFWPTLWASVSGPLVAHNAAFDMSVLRHALDQCGMPYPNTEYFCTRVLSRIAWPQHATYALDHVAQSIGITFQHHDAQEDARACALIAMAACRQMKVVSLNDLPDAVGLRIGRIYNGGHWPCGGPYAPHAHRNHAAQLRALDILPTGEPPKEGCPCSGMSFVFTGALCSMERRDAMQAVVDRGGICHDSVKGDTDFLVLGQEGFRGYRAGHKSSKMRKAEDMRAKGALIEILSESDFLGML